MDKTDKMNINCPYCNSKIYLDIWKLKSSHKIYCEKCNKFFRINIKGDTPAKIKNQIDKEIKKILRNFK
jgi:uncharacterized protein YbaR (Trm112 family)